MLLNIVGFILILVGAVVTVRARDDRRELRLAREYELEVTKRAEQFLRSARFLDRAYQGMVEDLRVRQQTIQDSEQFWREMWDRVAGRLQPAAQPEEDSGEDEDHRHDDEDLEAGEGSGEHASQRTRRYGG